MPFTKTLWGDSGMGIVLRKSCARLPARLGVDRQPWDVDTMDG